MASRKRNLQFLKSIFDDENLQEAMINSDCDQCILKAGYSILNKCGNCQYHMKCGTDVICILRKRTDLDKKLKLQDITSGKIMEMLDFTYGFMIQEMGEEKFKTMIDELVGISGIDLQEIISAVDEVYSQCDHYNKINIIQNGGDPDQEG